MQFYTTFMQPTHAGNGDWFQPKSFPSSSPRNSFGTSNNARSTSCSQRVNVPITNDPFEPTAIKTPQQSSRPRNTDENALDPKLGDTIFDWVKNEEEMGGLDGIEPIPINYTDSPKTSASAPQMTPPNSTSLLETPASSLPTIVEPSGSNAPLVAPPVSALSTLASIIPQEFHSQLINKSGQQQLHSVSPPTFSFSPQQSHQQEKKKSDDDDSSQDSPERWQEKFNELVEFKNKNGHCNVRQREGRSSSSGSTSSSLALWVKRQRYHYKRKMNGKHHNLTDERQQALESIGFIFDIRTNRWDDMFRLLKKYYMEHGHANVPVHYKPNKSFGIWVKRQRRQYKLFCENNPASNMTHERAQLLREVGF